MRLAILASCLTLTLPATAQEFIATEGRLSDEDFYRLVACAAPPAAQCQKQMIRWPGAKTQGLSVGLVTLDPGYPDYKRRMIETALEEAILQINEAGAGVTLVPVATSQTPDIPVYLTGARRGEAVEGTGLDGLDGRLIEAGLMVLWHQNGEINRAAVALSRDIRRRSIASILLEELTQALGLTTDIRNPDYRRQTVFDEDGNSVTRLGEQDITALRKHYPLDPQTHSSASN